MPVIHPLRVCLSGLSVHFPGFQQNGGGNKDKGKGNTGVFGGGANWGGQGGNQAGNQVGGGGFQGGGGFGKPPTMGGFFAKPQMAGQAAGSAFGTSASHPGAARRK